MKRLFAVLGLASLVTITTHAPAGAAPKEQKIVLTVTRNGFEPANVKVRAGQPVRLVVTRQVERTCATDIVIKELGISKPLPLGKAVEVTFTPRKAGTLRYACAMDMIAGELLVR